MATRQQQRRGTAAQWASLNPVLRDGEIGVVKGSDVIKVGDGFTPWSSLPALAGLELVRQQVETAISGSQVVAQAAALAVDDYVDSELDLITKTEAQTGFMALQGARLSVMNRTNSLKNAIGDGLPHPLSERFVSLAAAQAVFPHVTALTEQIDWAAIQSAVNDQPPSGGVVVLPAGRFVCNKAVVGRTSVSIVGSGMGVTILDYTLSTISSFCMSYSGTLSEQILLTADAGQSAKTITVADAAGIVKGDLLLVGSDAPFLVGATPSTTNKRGELVEVDSVAGNVVTLTAPLLDGYLMSDAARIKRMSPVRNITLQGFSLIRETQQTASRQGIGIYYGDNIRVRDVEVDYATEKGLEIRACRDVVVDGCRFQHNWYSGTGTSYGVALIDACHSIVVNGCYFYDHRHAVTGGKSTEVGATRFVKVTNNFAIQHPGHTPVSETFDTHPSTQFWTFDNNTSHGTHYAYNLSGVDHVVSNATAYAHGFVTEVSVTNAQSFAKRLTLSNNIFRARPDTPAGYSAVRWVGNELLAIGNRFFLGSVVDYVFDIGLNPAGIYSDDHLVANNYAEGFRVNAVRGTGIRRSQIVGNRFIKNGGGDAGGGIRLSSNNTESCHDVLVSNNFIEDRQATPTMLNGVRSNASTNTGMHFYSNVVKGSTDVPIAFTALASNGAPVVTGSRGGNAALTDLLSELASTGAIVNSSTA